MQLPSLKGVILCKVANSLQGSFFVEQNMSKAITTLYFNQASYFVGDNHGNELLLKINYYDNKFDLKKNKIKNGNISLLIKEAEEIARDLLKRKSRVNRAV